MPAADTARLIASLELKDLFSKQLGSAEKSLGAFGKTLDSTQGRAYKAGQQIGVGIRNAAAIAVSALGTLGGLLALSAKEGQHAADVQNVYNKAIANSGKITPAFVSALNAQSLALSNLSGQDDELIRQQQTRLVQMGLTGEQITKLLPLILDAAQSTGRDIDSVTLAVGRAVQGSATSLGRLGIIVPKVAKATKSAALASLEQQKALLLVTIAQDKANGTYTKSVKATLDHRKAVLDAAIAHQKYTDSTNKSTTATSNFDTVVGALSPFKGVNEALSGSLDVRLKVLRERLQDVREEAGIKLLPALTRIVGSVTTGLIPAFQSFVDGILPDVISGLDKFANLLSSGAATKTIDEIKDAVGSIAEGAKITGKVIQAAVQGFLALPPEIQKIAIAGLAINKLTGGLVTNIAGGLISSVLKQLVSGVVNVNGGVVNVNGGLPGGVPGTPAPTGGIGTVGKVFLAAESIAAIAAVISVQQGQSEQNSNLATGISASVNNQITGGASLADLKQSLAAVDQGIADINNVPFNVLVTGDALDQLKSQDAALRAQLAILERGYPLMTGTEANTGKAADDIAGVVVAVGQSGNRLVARLDSLHIAFNTDLAALIKATKALDVQKAAKKVGAEVSKGVGSADTTEKVLATLRTQLSHALKVHDAETASVLKEQIAKVERVLPDRKFAAAQYAAVNGILKDGIVTASESKKLHTIMQQVKDHGLPAVTKGIQQRIDAAKATEKAALAAVKGGVAAVKGAVDRDIQAIKDKDLSVSVTVPITTQVSIREFNTVSVRANSFGKIAVKI